jgi:ribosomal protein S18 acetylase RimI-like enzyme
VSARVRLRDLREEELADWLAAMHRFYVQDLERNLGLSRAEAEAKSERDHDGLFPDGRPADDVHAFVIENEGGETIGRLLFAERPFGAWLYAVELDERFRGQGLGRAAMLAFEERARERGAAAVKLNVFGGNEAARSLYRSLGYTEEAVQMGKPL